MSERSEYDRPVGQLLDGLGVTLDLRPEQQVIEVLVIAKVADFKEDEGTPRLGLGSSTGLDWMAELALIEAARIFIRRHHYSCLSREDE